MPVYNHSQQIVHIPNEHISRIMDRQDGQLQHIFHLSHKISGHILNYSSLIFRNFRNFRTVARRDYDTDHGLTTTTHMTLCMQHI